MRHQVSDRFIGDCFVAVRQKAVKLVSIDVDLRIANLLQLACHVVAAACRVLAAGAVLGGRLGAFVALAVVNLLLQLDLTLVFAGDVSLSQLLGVCQFLIQLAQLFLLLQSIARFGVAVEFGKLCLKGAGCVACLLAQCVQTTLRVCLVVGEASDT